MPTDLPNPIRLFLADFVARRRRLALAKSSALALAAGLAILLLACMADRLFKLPGAVRAVLLVGDLAVVVMILRRPILDALRGHANWIEAAGQVEAIDPAFAQRLITVTSQLQSPAAHRGSAGMLAALVAEVSSSAEQRRGSALLDWRRIKRSLTLAGCFLAVTLAAMAIPWLQFPQLVARFTRPWANLSPVTSTHLAVLPGSTNIPQGRPLHVAVTAAAIGDGAVQLHVQQPDGWAVSTLESPDAEHFIGDLPPLDRDTRYFVTGGDARSETFAVHVLTSPGLNELRARVVYPAYLKWPTKSLVVNDGRLEVPAGSEVSLSIVATEPLADAVLNSPAFATPKGAAVDPKGGGDPKAAIEAKNSGDSKAAIESKSVTAVPSAAAGESPTVTAAALSDFTAAHAAASLPTTASVDPAVRVARLTVTRDLTAAVTLLSAQGVEQAVAQPITIKAIPDRPPLVRLLTPTEDLRLGPNDLLNTAGQALDDYGIEQLFLQIKVNDRAPIYQPISFTGDARRVELPITSDLATLGLQVGDYLQFTLFAKDGAGQQRGSDVLRVIVSPRSFDLNGYLRVAELKAAKKLADDVVASLQTARNELNQTTESIAREGDKSQQALAAAAQSAQLLSLPLMRAAARADRVELGDSIAVWADIAEHVRSVSEELQDQRVRRVEVGRISNILDKVIDRETRSADQMGKALRQIEALAIRNDFLSAKDLSQRAEKASSPDRERLTAAASRLRESMQAAAKTSGLSIAEAGEVMPEIESAIAQGAAALQQNPPIDFAPPASTWLQILQGVAKGKLIETRSSLELLTLPSRLETASQVEMVRPDADFGRARDMSLAAHAGHALTTAAVAIDAPGPIKAAIGEYPGAIKALQAEHALHRLKVLPADAAKIASDALVARNKMRAWAGETDPTLASTNDPQDLALDAAAAQQAKKFEEARAIDKNRAVAMKSPAQKKQQKDLLRDTATAQRLELLRQRQQQLAQQTAEAVKQAAASGEEKTAGEQQLRSLARQQEAMAKAIEQAREQRDELADDQDKSADGKKADDPVAAIADARKALGDLQNDNDAVRKAPNDAAKTEQAKELDPSAVDAANQRLAKLSPTADDAHQQIDDKVIGGVRQMQQDARGKDASAVAHHADDVDAAVKEAMKKLDAAEEKLADRDALAAAQAAAGEAGENLKQAGNDPDAKKSDDANDSQKSDQANAETNGPPGTPKAGPPGPTKNGPPTGAKQSGNHAGKPGSATAAGSRGTQSPQEAATNAQQAQSRTLSALELAVDRANAGGGQARVRETPLIDSILSMLPVLVEGTGPGTGGADRAKVDLPSVREWGRLRPRNEQAQTAVAPATDPPGYEQSLRLYFETLGKKSE